MTFQLAQVNVATFLQPQQDPINADFMNNLDRINALAEQSDGFVWRFTGEGNDAIDIQAFDDPLVAVNMSVWESKDALYNFVYGNAEHLAIMKRRREWFSKMSVHMALWWVPTGHLPSLQEAKDKLALLEQLGPTAQAFTFAQFFPVPDE